MTSRIFMKLAKRQGVGHLDTGGRFACFNDMKGRQHGRIKQSLNTTHRSIFTTESKQQFVIHFASMTRFTSVWYRSDIGPLDTVADLCRTDANLTICSYQGCVKLAMAFKSQNVPMFTPSHNFRTNGLAGTIFFWLFLQKKIIDGN